MSRSIRQAVFVQGYGSPTKRIDKRLAEKAVRNFQGEISDGRCYRKISNSWEIADWHFDERWDPKGAIDIYHLKKIHGRYYQNK